MGRPRKPIQKRSNGVYCVQLHLGGKRVTRSLGTRDIEVAHRRAAQAMAELEAAHKAKQEGETRWRDAKEFSRLLELSEALDPETTAEQYTGKRAQDDVSGAFLDKNTEALAQALLKREVPALERSHPRGRTHPHKEEPVSLLSQLASKCGHSHKAVPLRAC